MTFKKKTIILIGLICLFVLIFVLFKIFYPFSPLSIRDSTPNEKQVALVIGNSHYPDNVLPNSQNEAYIAEVLRGDHFTVIHKQDLNQLGKKSSDYNGDGRNGLYTNHLLEAMKTPGLAIKQVFRQAAIQVTLASDAEQVPLHSDSLTDEIFCFTPPCKQLGIEFERLTNYTPANNTQQIWFSANVFSDHLSDGSLGPKMVMIPDGSFCMDDMKGEGRNEEQPTSRVSMNHQFAMGKNEVTVAEFRRFVKATGYNTEAEKGKEKGCWVYKDAHWEKPEDANWRNPYFPQNDDHPVVCVSWNDAVAYAKWLSEQTNQQYDLPIEAKWEYAARAKTTTQRYWEEGNDNNACHYANVADQTSQEQTSQSKKHFFSWIMQTEKPKKELSSRDIHNCIDGYIYTAAVGSFKKNNFGLYDMLGNVWEWCADPWDENSFRVIRGGAWSSKPKYVQAAFSFGYSSEDRYHDVGFRLSRLVRCAL